MYIVYLPVVLLLINIPQRIFIQNLALGTEEWAQSEEHLLWQRTQV